MDGSGEFTGLTNWRKANAQFVGQGHTKDETP